MVNLAGPPSTIAQSFKELLWQENAVGWLVYTWVTGPALHSPLEQGEWNQGLWLIAVKGWLNVLWLLLSNRKGVTQMLVEKCLHGNFNMPYNLKDK